MEDRAGHASHGRFRRLRSSASHTYVKRPGQGRLRGRGKRLSGVHFLDRGLDAGAFFPEPRNGGGGLLGGLPRCGGLYQKPALGTVQESPYDDALGGGPDRDLQSGHPDDPRRRDAQLDHCFSLRKHSDHSPYVPGRRHSLHAEKHFPFAGHSSGGSARHRRGHAHEQKDRASLGRRGRTV